MIKHQKLPKNILQLLPKALDYLEAHPKVLFAYLFGGLVKGNLQPLSDVDIASHIIADKGYRVPKSYSDAFKVLLDEKIVSSRLFDVLQKMAKFRNIVVHHYDKVDAEIVVGILKKDLKDFMSYKDAVISFLKSEAESETQ